MTIRFRTAQSEFIYVRTYSRWREADRRRETWDETVARYMDHIDETSGRLLPDGILGKIENSILNFGVMPSMRAVWSAGPAALKDSTTCYNCAFVTVDDPAAFWECLYILMCGTGVGFSVELQHVSKLPTVPAHILSSVRTYEVQDSRDGWADSLKDLMISLWSGQDIEMNYDSIRRKGTRLITMGGRASGPEPLIILHEFVRDTFFRAVGRKLTPLECHDLMNSIAEIVVVGGVRRSSQISLSDLDDVEMRDAKIWPYPQRRNMSNNSAVFYGQPSVAAFMREWAALVESGTGERGIFNLAGARANSPARRDATKIAGINPCAEILLRSTEFCNLSEVVARPEDDLGTMLEKIEIATWIGAIQSTFTHFPYLRDSWRTNCEEERLLGVSITGQMDAPQLFDPQALIAYQKRAQRTAKIASDHLNINMPAAITTGKPSGTVSQLVDSASGMHPRYAKYYARRYRIADTDPLLRMLLEQGIKTELAPESRNTYVVSFPVAAPTGAITRNDLSAVEQLNWYLKFTKNYTEHNQSCTVYYDDAEAIELGAHIYKNWDHITGVSFLPRDGGKHKLAPYEELNKKDFQQLEKETPALDYSKLSQYELEDGTSSIGSYACIGDRCEMADLGA